MGPQSCDILAKKLFQCSVSCCQSTCSRNGVSCPSVVMCLLM